MQEQVDRIIEMGDPVGAFLASDEFTSVDPRQQDEEVPVLASMGHIANQELAIGHKSILVGVKTSCIYVHVQSW